MNSKLLNEEELSDFLDAVYERGRKKANYTFTQLKKDIALIQSQKIAWGEYVGGFMTELSQQLRNLPRTDNKNSKYPIDAYEDDLVALIEKRERKARIDQAEVALYAAEKGSDTERRLQNQLNDLDNFFPKEQEAQE